MIGMIELATTDNGTFWTVVREFARRDGGRRSRSASSARSCCCSLCAACRCPTRRSTRCAMLAAAGVIYGAPTVAHGSGFLAVFVAGILVGDGPVPHKREIDGSSPRSPASRRS